MYDLTDTLTVYVPKVSQLFSDLEPIYSPKEDRTPVLQPLLQDNPD